VSLAQRHCLHCAAALFLKRCQKSGIDLPSLKCRRFSYSRHLFKTGSVVIASLCIDADRHTVSMAPVQAPYWPTYAQRYWSFGLSGTGKAFLQKLKENIQFCCDITPRGSYPILKRKLYSSENPNVLDTSTAEVIILLLSYSATQG
jgi:hypothetical protein